MKNTKGLTAGFLALTITAGTLFAPITARASEEGKRNTAIGIGALALGLLLTQRNKTPGIIAAGGAAYAYSQYDASVRARHRRERDDSYYYQDNGYRHDDGRQNHDYRNDNYNRDNGARPNDNSRYDRSDSGNSGSYHYGENNSGNRAAQRQSRR